MMPNSTINKKQFSPSLKTLAIFIVTSLLLSACGGGISGTGDGGPTIIMTDNSTGADAGVADSSGANVDGSTQEVNTSPIATDSNVSAAAPDVSQLIPESLLLLITRDENTSIAQPLVEQLNALQQEVGITLDMISSAQGMPTENISDTFDTTLRYSLNTAEIVIARSTTSTTSYLFSTNSERVFYVLQQDNTLTVRRLNRSSNSLLQATVLLLADSTTVIEADLNQNGIQDYIKTLSTDSMTTVFDQHPTDLSIARQRELIDSSGNLRTVQTCSAASQDCTLDSNWSNADSVTNTQFSTDLDTIDSNLANIVSPVSGLPASVNEAVLAQVNTEVPSDEQIHCGLQRVSGLIRAFCLLPQPLGTTSLFGETLAGGEIFYQLLE